MIPHKLSSHHLPCFERCHNFATNVKDVGNVQLTIYTLNNDSNNDCGVQNNPDCNCVVCPLPHPCFSSTPLALFLPSSIAVHGGGNREVSNGCNCCLCCCSNQQLINSCCQYTSFNAALPLLALDKGHQTRNNNGQTSVEERQLCQSKQSADNLQKRGRWTTSDSCCGNSHNDASFNFFAPCPDVRASLLPQC